MKSYLFKALLSALFFASSFVYSQDSPPQYKTIPKGLDGHVKLGEINDFTNPRRKNLVSLAEQSTTDRIWNVYSDRANNKLFESPGGGENGKTLKLMERVTVRDVRRSGRHFWLNVYSQRLVREDQPTQHHVERGWIKADNVLLTNFSLLNENSIPRKAMILYSLEDLDPSKEIKDSRYYHPQPSLTGQGREATRFRIYYVLKEKGNWLLLGTSDRYSSSNEEGNVLGWMEVQNITLWDHRMCLEQSSNPDAVEEYEGLNNYVFGDRLWLKDYYRQIGVTPVPREGRYLRSYQLTGKRPCPYNMRMPILEQVPGRTYQDINKVVTISISQEREASEIAEARKKLQELLDRQKEINILFVLDATHSMAPYIPRVRQTINKIIDERRMEEGLQTKLRFGLAVYRDYPDSENDQLYEIQPLTTDHSKVLNMLRRLFIGSVAIPPHEAQYQGLIKGTRDAGFHPSSSNVVVLVGDCGNHRDDKKYSTADVVDAFEQDNINLISFQVVYGTSGCYRHFTRDVRTYLMETAKRAKGNPRLKAAGFENSYRLSYPGVSESMASLYPFGRFTHASEAEPMNPQILEDNVYEAINQYLRSVDNGITYFKNLITGNPIPASAEEVEALINYLKLRGFSRQQIDIIISRGEITAQGFLLPTAPGHYYPAFTPVVYMSESEKSRMEETFRRLSSTSSHDNKRAFQNALIEEAKRMLGEDQEDIILNMSFKEIYLKILGVEVRGYPDIRETPLKNIVQVSDREFTRFYSEFKNKAKEFLVRDHSPSRFKLGNTYFYWVPLEHFPGSE